VPLVLGRVRADKTRYTPHIPPKEQRSVQWQNLKPVV
jgi:hypothetical protein